MQWNKRSSLTLNTWSFNVCNGHGWTSVFFLRPFLGNVPILYHLKTPENLWFSGVSRGYKMGTLVRNWLIVIKYQMLIYSLWVISVEIFLLGCFKSVCLWMIKCDVFTWYYSFLPYKKKDTTTAIKRKQRYIWRFSLKKFKLFKPHSCGSS